MDILKFFGGGDKRADDQPAAEPTPGGLAEDAAPAPLDTREQIVEVLQSVYDPEIPVNIWELGLVYEVKIDDGNHAVIRMTLTSPGCPVAESLPAEVENRVLAVPGVTSVRVELVWDPQWNPNMMSEAARLQLGMF